MKIIEWTENSVTLLPDVGMKILAIHGIVILIIMILVMVITLRVFRRIFKNDKNIYKQLKIK